VNALLHRRLTASHLRAVVDGGPDDVARLTDDHRLSLASRLRAVPHPDRRRLDAWLVERAGRPSAPFAWSPVTARRILGNNALRRARDTSDALSQAVRDEVADQLLRAASGYARAGSLGHWLATAPHPVLGLITAEALNWATTVLECVEDLDDWRMAPTDVYFDVAGARTTLRGRRDVVIGHGADRVVLRLRSGHPGKSAGHGLRSDLAVEALAHPEGVAPRRYLGLWPDAGLLLGVEGTMENVRAGGRDFVRAAVAQRRVGLVRAA